MLPTSRPSRILLAPRLLILVALVWAFVWVSGFPRTYDDEELPPGHPLLQNKPVATVVPHPVEAEQVVVAIKTTATDALSKIPPMLLLTHQSNHEQLLILGDMQMHIGTFQVHDVLDRTDADLLAHSPDLERYRKQVQYASHHRDIPSLTEKNLQKEKEVRESMDKYKYLRMLERAWDFLPERLWYVFVDTDTFLVRSNLLNWLGQHDSGEEHFFRNPPDLDSNAPFALGGSTFVLSVGAMRLLFTEREGVVSAWEERISKFSSGYDVLKSALSSELNLEGNHTWPGISGFNPHTVPYGPDVWCEPVIALEGVSAGLQSDIWRLQRDREEYQHRMDPLTFMDLWQRFIQPEGMTNARDDWDNLCSSPDNARWNILFEEAEQKLHGAEHMRHMDRDEEGRAKSGEKSWEACRKSCNGHEHCVQWSYSSTLEPNHNENGKTKCHLSRSFRLGGWLDPQEIKVNGENMQRKWASGWRRDRFEEFAKHQRCKGQQN
ncbi:hypothetical protein BDV96DRAFT_564673 [Lophiotrema nucula]|uniref:Glycosyltransferase family 31 protein n=1 Tax=Lophiotrema nucula TaxID=690887 RepID=A0A6A5ZTU2_9PLEO|nr:hypothetical protein BDV96DRAFT_564673 [Lophiotrema nucula]